MEMATRHLLILCCYGGQPFVDFHPKLRPISTRALDPTDWIATDIAGALLNASLSASFLDSHPSIRSVVSGGVPLEACDLFNLTFTNTADEHLYESYMADLACRCSPSRWGVACERDERDRTAAALTSPKELVISATSSSLNSASMILVALAVLFAVCTIGFMAMRGCFCDCFGPWRNPCAKDDEDDKPLDRASIEHALNAVREYETRRYGEQSRPLISTVSEGCAAPYNTTVITPTAPRGQEVQHPPPPHMNPYYRAPSPPPSYSSVAGSTDRLPTSNSQV